MGMGVCVDGLEEPFKAYTNRNSAGCGVLSDGTGFEKPKEVLLTKASHLSFTAIPLV